MKKAEIDKIIFNNQRGGTVISDGLTNVRGEHMVNYLYKIPGHKPMYLKTVNTSGEKQDSPGVARGTMAIIGEIGADKVYHTVSDNANVMKGSWPIIVARYPHITAYGCAAHATNLLVYDIHKDVEFKKLCDDGDFVVNFVNNHHFTSAKFNDLRGESEEKIRKLIHHVKTRWYTLYNFLLNLQNAKTIVEKMVDEFEDEIMNIQPRAKALQFTLLIKNRNFWNNLEKWLAKIELPSKIIGKLEGDDASVEIVMDCYIQLYDHFSADHNIRSLVVKRWEFIATDMHRAAHLLNHKFAMNIKYLPNEEMKCLTAIEKESVKFRGREFADKVLEELPQFLQQMNELEHHQKSTLTKLSSLKYWEVIGTSKFPSLAALTKKVFGLASSAPSERAWSILRFILNRLRNRTANVKVDRILFVRINEVIHDPNIDIDLFLEDLEDLDDSDLDSNSDLFL